MKRASQRLLFCLCGLVLLTPFQPIAARAELVDIQFDQLRLSATLDRAPLEAVCQKIGQERNVWFISFVSPVNGQITAQFKDLSLEAALKRILAATNYSLVFDETETVMGVIIIGHKTPGSQQRGGWHVAVGNVLSVDNSGEMLNLEPSSQPLTGDDGFTDTETAQEGIGGVAEIVEDTPGLDLPMEEEIELANLERDAAVDEPVDVDEQEQEEFSP